MVFIYIYRISKKGFVYIYGPSVRLGHKVYIFPILLRRENPHHPLWFFSLAFNFEVTSLGCARRGPALLYMGVVSLSTGGLVGRGGGRRREFTMSRSRAACVGRAPCHSRRVAQAPESLGVRAKSAERCDVDHCVSSILDSNLLQVLKFIYYTLYYSPRFLPHIDAPGSNKKIILATRTQAKKLREVGGGNQALVPRTHREVEPTFAPPSLHQSCVEKTSGHRASLWPVDKPSN